MSMRGIWMLLAIAGCGSGETKLQSTNFDGWEISTSAPAIDGASVTGSFSTSGEGMRAFGACLVADLFDGKACSSRADCATGAVLPQSMQHVDYCLKGAGEAQSTCWSRGPDMEWCNKAPPPGRVAGSFSTPTVDAANVAGSGQKTRFVTLVCVNAASYPMFSDGPLPPCASADPAAASYRVNVVSAVSRYP